MAGVCMEVEDCGGAESVPKKRCWQAWFWSRGGGRTDRKLAKPPLPTSFL